MKHQTLQIDPGIEADPRISTLLPKAYVVFMRIRLVSLMHPLCPSSMFLKSLGIKGKEQEAILHILSEHQLITTNTEGQIIPALWTMPQLNLNLFDPNKQSQEVAA